MRSHVWMGIGLLAGLLLGLLAATLVATVTGHLAAATVVGKLENRE